MKVLDKSPAAAASSNIGIDDKLHCQIQMQLIHFSRYMSRMAFVWTREIDTIKSSYKKNLFVRLGEEIEEEKKKKL